MRVGFVLLNRSKDVLDFSRVIDCLEKYGHEGYMYGYDPNDRNFKKYIKDREIDMLVMGESQTAWPRQFGNYSKIINFPTLVVEGEGMVCDFTAGEFFEHIHAHKLSAWGNKVKNYYDTLGFNEDDIITINGPPRLDMYHPDHNHKILTKEEMCEEINMKRYGDPEFGLDPNRPIITFFSYPPRAFVPNDLYYAGTNYEKLRAQTTTMLCNNLPAFGNCQLVIKCHPAELDWQHHQEIKDMIGHKMDDIHILGRRAHESETPVYNLIYHSDLVIGYQSTTMVESMICKKPIVLTYWDPFTMQRDDLIPFDNEGLAEVVRNKDEFGATVKRIIDEGYTISEDMQNEREKFIYEYCYKQDGKAGERVAKMINDMLVEFYG